MAYDKQQWIESFEGQLSILRPHLTERVLASYSVTAWHQFGTEGEDPIQVARELSRLLDRQATAAPKKP